MTQTVYVKLNQITQVHEKAVFLSDIAEVYCSDKPTASRCRAVKVQSIHSDKEKRYMGRHQKNVCRKCGNLKLLKKKDIILHSNPEKFCVMLWINGLRL